MKKEPTEQGSPDGEGSADGKIVHAQVVAGSAKKKSLSLRLSLSPC